jgi:hypothetical protein
MKMESRTTSRPVTFRHPFWISGLDTRQAAGTYTVDTEEELLETSSFLAWKHVATHIIVAHNGSSEYVRINRDELDDALARDAMLPV